MAQPADAELLETPSSEGDSIAERLAARMAERPAVPRDAMDWATLAAVYEREARALSADPAAARLLHEAGRIHEERLGDPQAALACYRRAMAADRLLVANLQSARRVAHELKDVELECEIMEAETAAARDPRDQAALALARARLLEERLGRKAEGRSALETDRASLAAADHEAVLAAEEGRHEDLAQALERCAERSSAPRLAAAFLMAASSVEEHRLHRLERAAELAFRAFELHQDDPSVRSAARRQAERLQRFEVLAAVLAADARAEHTPSRERALALCSLSQLEERLGKAEKAHASLEGARRVGGADPVVLDALVGIHEARGDWEAAAGALRARTEAHVAGAPGDALELVCGNVRLAALCEERLGRIDEAIACYRAALSIDPGHRGALTALGRLHARAGNWEQLLETFLSERAVTSDQRERASRCFKAAEVLEERLGRVEKAIDLYAEALALEPTLLAAHQALERLYEKSGCFDKLAALLEADLDMTSQSEERVALLFRLAPIYEERLGDLEGAARCCERILEIAPEHVVALHTLASVRGRAGRFADAIDIHERLVKLTIDTRKAIALLQRKAELQEEKLADEAAAAITHERILKLDPGYLPSLRALGRLYLRAGRFVDLVTMFRAEAEVTPSTEGAAALLYRAGEILEQRLSQEREAVTVYREVVTLSPSHLGALRALARLYRSSGDFESLVEVLRAEAAAQEAPERKAALLCEVALICETRLGDLDRAIEVHDEVLHIAPSFSASLRALERLLAERGRFGDLAMLCRKVADSTHGPARVEWLVGAARLLADRIDDLETAKETCQAALAEAPGDFGALILLERLGGSRADAREALAAALSDARTAAAFLVAASLDRAAASQDETADLLRAMELDPTNAVAAPLGEGILRRAREPGAFLAYLAARRDTESEKTARAAFALRMGEAFEDAGNLDAAIAAYRESLTLSPDTLVALGALRRIHTRENAWGEARAALHAEGACLRDPILAAAAFTEAGEIALSQLKDPAGAAADWRRALGLDPIDETIADRLATVLRTTGNLAELRDLCETRARVERVPERAVDRWMEAARLAEQLGEHERALADLEAALSARPAFLDALLLRGRIRGALGESEAATRDFSACLALCDGAAATVPVHLELGALCQGPLGDAARATSHLNAVLAAEPENAEALSRLARLHREAGNWPAAADFLRRLLALPSLSPETSRAHLIELADVRVQGFGDMSSAIDLLERALALGEDTSISERLARLRGRAESGGSVVSALEGAVADAAGGPDRARIHLRAARVLSTMLGDSKRAAAELRRAVEADPSNVEARAALADFYATREPTVAIEEHRRLIEEDPARLESWRALYAIFRASNAHDRAFVVASVLRFLGASDPARDGAFLDENTPQAPTGTSQVLASTEWFALRHPADRGPLSDLLSIVGDVLAVAAANPAPQREKLKSGPLADLAEELCANIGVSPFTLLLGSNGPDAVIEPGDPPFVRVGPGLLRRTGTEQRFLLARMAARVRSRSGLAARKSAGELGDLVAAAVRQVVNHYAATGQPSAALEKAVARALPRRLRKQLSERAAALAQAGPQDVAAWQAGLAATADRVGLLFSVDLTAALGLRLREGGGPADSADGVTAAVRARVDLQHLLAFVLSEDHLRLRQRLRLAIA
ncbi:MAG TPA: tetratricopeptide repeat protein [Anaeromyxobacteraceae bacterium]|nr:tetratricopeptide repeat protein [Anaeromyxobacteraceae bacterium]